jgi:acyl-CoA synthetase (AMP-forming)/AMP-acid ligase II
VLTVCDSGHEAPGDLPSLDTLAAAAPEAPARKGDPNNEDCGCYIYTSGTTGLPKAAIVSNIKLLLTGSLFGRGILEIGPNDVTYMTLPLYHSNGMFGGVSASLTTGATLALRRKFSASNFWADVRRFDATCFVYIGELCRYLLNQPESPLDGKHRLRVIAGNGLRPDIWRRFEERFKVPLIREFYGATEGNMPLVNFAGRPGMVGRLLPGQAILRCDAETGELLRNAEGFCTRVETGQSGLLVSLINDRIKFDGYLDREASKKKVLENVFKAGDRYFNTGDLITTHPRGWASFADRIGDTFRWKGENVSTNEVAELLNHATGVLEANVYGVQVPDTEGRAGMASLHTSEEFSIDRFALHVLEKLPGFQRPYFLRIQKDMRITGTFKHQKVDYRKEGYDPSKVADPLYFLEGDQYVPLDTPLYETIQSGEKKLR